jgi:type II pantothenate kinase
MSATAQSDDYIPGGDASITPLPSRMRTNTAEIDETIIHPGSVKINVLGAFIVDQQASSPKEYSPSGGSHETKDIRLPNHTAVVSHIAVDVGASPS